MLQSSIVSKQSGCFYGTTATGGKHDGGTVFRLTPEGVFTTLHSFTGSLDGFLPEASLVLGPDGNFYGTTSAGGAEQKTAGQARRSGSLLKAC